MRPPELAAIRPHLEQAVSDIDYYLTGLEEQEKVKSELSELYDLMVADKTPPEVKGQAKSELTPEQYAAIEWRTAAGEPITDEQREAVLAGVLPGQPVCDEGWAALQFALRGGWWESSRQAATWLRNAGETVAADGIEVALSQLPVESRDATERSGFREAMRSAAESVKTILVQYPIQRASGSMPEAVREAREEETEAATNPQVIEAMEQQTPTLDTKSVEWIAARQENEKKLGLKVETLRNYRAASKGGRRMPDKMFGVDRDGRCWRRQGTPTSMVYYFVPSIPKR